MKTLQEYLRYRNCEPKLIEVLEALVISGIEICELVNQGALNDILGTTEIQNIQGEHQKKLDIISNQIIKNSLVKLSCVAAIASEEENESVEANVNGQYLVAFDPLDGSSNIDINGQIGTIFGVYPKLKHLRSNHPEQFLQTGLNQICAGYILYGAYTQLTLTLGESTQCFTLDKLQRCFVLTQEKMQIPVDTQEFAINMSKQRFWRGKMRRYINQLLLGNTGSRRKDFNMRWSAAMVGDVHRIMIKGGIFLYPSDNRDKTQPAKLRLLYEANPMAMLVENAGGKAWNESQRILSIQPKKIHERVAVILGSANEVDACLREIL